jgi:hypothetical protein
MTLPSNAIGTKSNRPIASGIRPARSSAGINTRRFYMPR